MFIVVPMRDCIPVDLVKREYMQRHESMSLTQPVLRASVVDTTTAAPTA